jgi:hypothetical protein
MLNEIGFCGPNPAVAMDLTDRIKEFRSRQRNVLSWLFTSMLPQRVIVDCGSRLKLLLIG